MILFKNIFRIVCITTILMIATQSNAHITENDSIRNILKSGKEDTGKFYLFQNLYNKAWLNDMNAYHNYVEQALNLSKKLNYTNGVMKAQNALGLYFMMESKLDSAIYMHEQALKLAEKSGNKKFMYVSYLGKGDNLKRKGKNQEAMELITKCIRYFEDTPGCDSLLLRSLLCAAEIHLFLPNGFEKALEMANRHMKIAEEMQDSFQIAVSNEVLGIVYGVNGDYNKGLSYFIKSLELYKKFGPEVLIAAAYSHIGTCYLQIRQNSKGIWYLNKAKDSFLELTDIRQLVNIYEELGNHFIKQKQYDKGFEELNLALNLALKGQLAKSIRDNYKYLSNAYESYGNKDKALEYHKLFHEMDDSIIRAANLNRISELQTQYETVKREKEIESLRQEKEIQLLAISERNNLLIAFGLSFVLLFILGFFYFRWTKLRNEKKQSDLEQKALRSQMNPHFIFNALSSINNYIISNDTSSASQYLTKFARLMRQILEHTREEMIPLQKEIEMLENYLQLERVRFNMKFDYQLNIYDDVDPEEIFIPPLIIQPFVENSIKHGFSKLEKDGLITITFKLKDNNLQCLIRDNGIGFSKSKTITLGEDVYKKSLGMEIVNERARKFNKKYGQPIKIEINDILDQTKTTRGTSVALEIPRINSAA